jgi:hypothetical protein
MDMHGLPSGVRPEAVVDLFSVDELACHSRSTNEKRPEFDGFILREIGYRCDVAFRLHDQSPYAKWSYTVLN